MCFYLIVFIINYIYFQRINPLLGSVVLRNIYLSRLGCVIIPNWKACLYDCLSEAKRRHQKQSVEMHYKLIHLAFRIVLLYNEQVLIVSITVRSNDTIWRQDHVISATFVISVTFRFSFTFWLYWYSVDRVCLMEIHFKRQKLYLYAFYSFIFCEYVYFYVYFLHVRKQLLLYLLVILYIWISTSGLSLLFFCFVYRSNNFPDNSSPWDRKLGRTVSRL